MTHRPRRLGGSVSDPRRGPAKEFLEWALRQQTDECIEWPHALDKDGYGQIWIGGRAEHGGRKVAVHIIACTRVHGAMPPGMTVAHGECHNRKCINPRHLSWKTVADNNHDKLRDGTNKPRRLTAREVREIRQLWATGEWTLQQLAAEFGVSSGKYVHRIITRKRRRDVSFTRLR